MNMNGAMHKLSVQPILDPASTLVVIVNQTFPLFKQAFVHHSFGCIDFHNDSLCDTNERIFRRIKRELNLKILIQSDLIKTKIQNTN